MILVYYIFILKKHRKTLFRFREGGRTVGSGRVATVIE
jgi:translation elongation factor EF-Tu-like GTPase